jgi:hypothetical protein
LGIALEQPERHQLDVQIFQRGVEAPPWHFGGWRLRAGGLRISEGAADRLEPRECRLSSPSSFFFMMVIGRTIWYALLPFSTERPRAFQVFIVPIGSLMPCISKAAD